MAPTPLNLVDVVEPDVYVEFERDIMEVRKSAIDVRAEPERSWTSTRYPERRDALWLAAGVVGDSDGEDDEESIAFFSAASAVVVVVVEQVKEKDGPEYAAIFRLYRHDERVNSARESGGCFPI